MSDPQDTAMPVSPVASPKPAGTQHTARDSPVKSPQGHKSTRSGVSEAERVNVQDTLEEEKEEGPGAATERSSKIDEILEKDDSDDVFGQIAETHAAEPAAIEPEAGTGMVGEETADEATAEKIQAGGNDPVAGLFEAEQEEADDPFAQVAQEDSPAQAQRPGQSDAEAQEIEPVEELPTRIEDIFDGEEADDPFGEINQTTETEHPDRAKDSTQSAQHSEEASTRIGDIFGGEEPGDDPFGAISREEEIAGPTETGESSNSGAPPRIADIFAGNDESDDPFGQIQQGDEHPEESIPDEKPIEEVPTRINQIFGEGDDSTDAFAELAIEKEEPSDAAFSSTTTAPFNAAVPATAAQTAAEKDFSDLLAEFEDDFDIEPSTDNADAPAASGEVAANPTPAALFADDNADFIFDEFAQHQLDPTSEPSTQGGQDADAMAESKQDDGNDPITFDIPQGWYDDAGEWNWYTEEQKELVRQTMVGEADWIQPETPAPQVQDLSTSLYSPALGAGQSENAARRTPQPDQMSKSAQPSTSYDPYAPPISSLSSTTSPYTPSSSSWATSAALYAPASSSAFAPAITRASPYDPYAPSTSFNPSAGPNGTPGRSYTASGAPSSFVGARSQAPDTAKPKPPTRVVSNAYDPPFLRPQKSFVRPASALSLTPAPFTAPQTTASPPPQPTAPPPGPPRRTKTPSAAPAYAAPPARTEPPMPKEASLQQAYQSPPMQTQDPYKPPQPQPLAQSQQSHASLSNQPAVSTPAQSRPPPRNQSYNSFDPPLRPSSAARARPVAAVAPERTVTPTVAALAPPPAQTAPAGPPRGPSRSSMRKPSPMFESRPALPASEKRPPSRASVASVKGQSPLVGATEVPSRPGSRAQEPPQMAPQQSHPATPRHAPEETYAREAGTDEGETPAWSPQKPQQISSSEQEESSLGISNEDTESSRAYSQESIQTTRATSPETSLYDRPADAQEVDNDQRQQQSVSQYNPHAQSAYDPSPYQPSVPSATEPSGLPRSRPPKQESYGLGLGGVDEPDSQPQSVYNPYAPTDTSSYAPQSSANTYQPPSHTRQTSSYDPYAPTSQSSLLNPSDAYSRPAADSSYGGSDLGISPPQPSYFQAMAAPPADNTYVPQQVLEQRPIAEDPLGRSTLAARNTPLAVFGFGGVLITGFPAQAESDTSMGHHRTPSYGYASGRGQLWIRTVSELASTSALKPNDNIFPGPLVADPSTPRGAAGDKKKREAVTAYLQARAEEIEKGLPYLKSSASQARREEEGKLVLVRILLAMVLGDGKLSGKPEVEDALKTALSNTPEGSLGTGIGLGASTVASNSNNQSAPARADSSRLTDLSNMLSRGEKREAAEYAARRGLWSHALVISSSVDQELWADMVMRFAQAELQNHPDMAALKASYAVFSGTMASSVDDLIAAANLTGDQSKDNWREVVGAVVFNGKPADLACLNELGSRLRKAGLNYPAHVCHLLSPSSPFADVTFASYEKNIAFTQNVRDEDAIIFAEIAEYARSLVALPKGQELPLAGLPQLLPYKLQRAWLAAELGDVDQAKRYCTAVEVSSKPSKNAPQFLSPALLASLEDLTERLTGTPSTNPVKLIGTRKTKSGAGIGSWIEGRLTKFIAGEEDSTTPAKPIPAVPNKDSDAPIGPFSHFSTISPAASSGVSRNTSAVDLDGPYGAGLSEISKTSPKISQSQWGQPDQQQNSGASSSYGGDYGMNTGTSGGSGWTSWSAGQEAPAEEDTQPVGDEDEGEFINPMAALSLGGPRAASTNDYQPPKRSAVIDEDDDEDMGFGNSSLSRNRTPKPAAAAGAQAKTEEKKAPVEDKKPEAEKPVAKSGWLGGWFGKKEGSGSGPVRAKLGEESSMVFDKGLKRWVVKGAKPEAAAPSPPPPPPRAQTTSPAQAARTDAPPGARTAAATPPPSQLRNGSSGSAPPSARPPTGQGFSETPDGGIRRMKSSLAESITADQVSTPSHASAAPPMAGPPSGGPPKPPTKAAGASIDDLLSRPPSKRPGSAAKKPMRNRYVDVLTPGTEKGS